LGGSDIHSLSIVIPTYNERANLDPLFEELAQLKGKLSVPFEVLIVDDRSPDGTRETAFVAGQQHGLKVRVITREGSRGLGTAIVAGLEQCDSDLACVMDADLSHPPELLPALVANLNGFDGTVASRYASGGRIAEWTLHRKIISFVATRIVHHLLDVECADPLSGYFVLRSACVRGIPLTGLGNKPLLEILSKTEFEVFEVPYQFRNRVAGKSKLTFRAILEFIWLILCLRRERDISRRASEVIPDEALISPPHS
jgi:dolichol-phosphate mannosyltransferase